MKKQTLFLPSLMTGKQAKCQVIEQRTAKSASSGSGLQFEVPSWGINMKVNISEHCSNLETNVV